MAYLNIFILLLLIFIHPVCILRGHPVCILKGLCTGTQSNLRAQVFHLMDNGRAEKFIGQSNREGKSKVYRQWRLPALRRKWFDLFSVYCFIAVDYLHSYCWYVGGLISHCIRSVEFGSVPYHQGSFHLETFDGCYWDVDKGTSEKKKHYDFVDQDRTFWNFYPKVSFCFCWLLNL